jgi:pyruvate-ferredoxin/flavodoxin oxidoreductase
VFHDYVMLGKDEREGKTPFIHAVRGDRTLRRLGVAEEIVRLAEDRLLYWNQLRELAGIKVPESVRDALSSSMEAELEQRMDALRNEYEEKIRSLKASYPRVIARKMAESLLRHGNTNRTVGQLLEQAAQTPNLEPIGPDVLGLVAPEPVSSGNGAARAATAPAAESAVAVAAAPAAATAVADDDDLALEPYIDTDRCTTCNECTNLNGKMFAYNANKQAYIKDAKAGTFAQLVQGAERCPAALIHPGTPLNPKEKDLAKWIERAKPFN